MRDLLDDLIKNRPLDPSEAARRSMRRLPRRFYKEASYGPDEHGGFRLLLDGKAARTPGRRSLSVPTRPVMEAIVAEWRTQTEQVDPAKMPVTRLANAIIDAVVVSPEAVAADIAKYLKSDLLFYRAEAPQGLVARQAAHWDPILAWARDALGARFLLVEGVMFAQQPELAVERASRAIPSDPWLLGGLHVIATLTGSALIALAITHGALTPDEAWQASHVDEDWNMAQWGEDELALQRRAAERAEFDAAVLVIASHSV